MTTSPLPRLGGVMDLTKPRLKRVKVKIDAQMLPMFATICPARIVGSEQSEGFVTLVLEGEKLPETEWATVEIERPSDTAVILGIKAISG